MLVYAGALAISTKLGAVFSYVGSEGGGADKRADAVFSYTGSLAAGERSFGALAS